jgi:hypothetical protein
VGATTVGTAEVLDPTPAQGRHVNSVSVLDPANLGAPSVSMVGRRRGGIGYGDVRLIVLIQNEDHALHGCILGRMSRRPSPGSETGPLDADGGYEEAPVSGGLDRCCALSQLIGTRWTGFPTRLTLQVVVSFAPALVL